MNLKQSSLMLIITISLAILFITYPANAIKVGVIMDDHSGPEYMPANPDGNQCVACSEGQPYTDGFDHSADGYFSNKYFLAHLSNISANIPGFVVDQFNEDAHHQGIILMDKDNPQRIVDDSDFFDSAPYTPALVDAWGEEGIFVDPSIPGADSETGYITYTDLYMNFTETDGTPLYIWPQPYPYPTENPLYPDTKKAANGGGVPFYLLPRDVMNEFEDSTFDGGGSLGYGPWTLPDGAQYLKGPIAETAGFYPDNGWIDMLGWEYFTNGGWEGPACIDFFAGIVDLFVDSWEEHDFWEFAALSGYATRLRAGGRAVYMEEVTGQMNQVKDWLWANYETTLAGGLTGENKDDYIKVTYMIDPCFCEGVNPKDNIHGRSLFDAVYDQIVSVGVDKIIIHDHFVGH
jgi:hypothetical protein